MLECVGLLGARTTTRIIVTVALSVVVAVNGSRRVGAFDIVFDPSNYSQNLLTAARALEQINNQVRSLENQAQSLLNQAKHLASLPTSVVGQLTSTIGQMNSLIAQAKGISFDVQKTQQDFAQLYPQQYGAATSSDRMVQDATARWNNSYEGLKQALTIQSAIVSNLDQDGQTLRTLMASSSAAAGSLQAQQSGNELLALQIKQALQTQALLATQARADTLRAAEERASAAAAQERFIRFIGDGHAYAGGR
ncbi:MULTISPECIES: P-type conjugative transfer protein TrbJ [Bradyrhizobium]|jgi:type IV secretion system protein TrbJ|uniref:P-type conjugative transfer protein TrbJ n=1 Tax=Bradyrhizobium TaxID=374 RepID=UPI000686198E|nr:MULTISPECIES: P-type conjugative transfer protein TrbJ [Bradyrhizobium]MCS3448632.1 P-type conjugative transfer protein TrbJ [Bradyrhizobium elkanii]MCS3560224.1 P-type conjugative transfer protein TrbJ [Bradyrhizobium elkanii]MCW2149929.1 P-type conjugative transfer protein TrbJ [Bradyrhizobium elkanii]MCW2360099.1 P-type conjugative transfer protein TrbJ [Bradyrhizobium elkanii]MCW2373661.1 P-type conjugative transfer protein TrbJ [Bradyrhizobium elkanii]